MGEPTVRPTHFTGIDSTTSMALRSQAGASDSRFHGLLCRIQGEYLEMPGLQLTLGQAQRIWQLSRPECETLLTRLVDSGFLIRTRFGAFTRAGSGRTGA